MEDKLEKKIEYLQSLVNKYEEDGLAKLYYSLKRKAWEMADMLNSINIKTIALDDPKDKTFERLRFIINDSSSIASAVKALGDAAGVTGNEEFDIRRKRTTPESIAEELGENKRQDV